MRQLSMAHSVKPLENSSKLKVLATWPRIKNGLGESLQIMLKHHKLQDVGTRFADNVDFISIIVETLHLAKKNTGSSNLRESWLVFISFLDVHVGYLIVPFLENLRGWDITEILGWHLW